MTHTPRTDSVKLTFVHIWRGALALALACLAAQALGAQTPVERQAARWDSVATVVLPALTRYCGTASSRAYVCEAADSLKRLTAAGRADTLTARDTTIVVTPPDTTVDSTVVVVPPDSTPPDSVIVTPGPPNDGGVNLTHPFPPPANGAGVAVLPQDTVSSAYPTVSRRTVCASNLQTCLDTAKAGDEIRLAPGASFSSPLTVRTSNVVVRGDVPLGGPWERMETWRADSLNLPTLTTATTDPAIWIASGVHHVRFAGVRFTTTAGVATNAIVRAGMQEADITQIPHHITFDRVVMDAGSHNVRRCLYGDVGYLAVLASALVNCHDNSGDSQAIEIINSPGPIRIEGSRLQGGHQSIMTGGGDPRVAGMLPRDIVIRRNVLCRPIAWKGTWPDKNGIEFKIGERILVEGNVICNAWPQGQTGMAVNLKTVNQSGGASWAHTGDVTIRYNRIMCTNGGFSLANRPDNSYPAVNTSRIAIYGNVGDSLTVAPCNGNGDGMLLSGVSDVLFLDNWLRNPNSRAAVYFVGVSDRFVATGNVLAGAYGWKYDSGTSSTLTPNRIVTNNTTLPGGSAFSAWPAVPVNAVRDSLLSGVTP